MCPPFSSADRPHSETNHCLVASGAHPGDTPRRKRTSIVRSTAWARISKKSVSQLLYVAKRQNFSRQKWASKGWVFIYFKLPHHLWPARFPALTSPHEPF